MNRSSHLCRGANRHVVPLCPNLSVDSPGNEGLVIESHKVAPEVAIQAHAICERHHAAVNLSGGIEVHHLVEGKNVLSHTARDGEVIRKRPDVPVDLSVDARRPRENNGISLDMSADLNALPEEKEVSLHGTVNSSSRTGDKDVALNRLILGKFIGAFGLVKLCGACCHW